MVFPSLSCDLWPMTLTFFWWALIEQKSIYSWWYTTVPNFNPTGPSASEIQAKTLFSIRSSDLWPVILIIWMNIITTIYNRSYIYTSPYQKISQTNKQNNSNQFSHLWVQHRTDEQTSSFQTISVTLACDLDLLLKHIMKKRWSTHGYTL